MSDDRNMIIKKALVRILDPDRRLVIDRGFVRAPEEFFDRYGATRFSNEQPTKKEIAAGVTVRTIEKWAAKSRAAENADNRASARSRAKREAAAAAAAAAAEDQPDEDASNDDEADIDLENAADELDCVDHEGRRKNKQ